jgi:hypothetical protein
LCNDPVKFQKRPIIGAVIVIDANQHHISPRANDLVTIHTVLAGTIVFRARLK